MSCRKIQDKIEEYIDGSFSQEEKRCFDEHLSGCDKCRQQVADMRATFGMLRDMEIKEVPKGLEERIIAAVQPVVPRKRSRCFSRKKVNAITAAAAALIIITLAAVNYPWLGSPQIGGTVRYKKPASVGMADSDYLSISNRFEIIVSVPEAHNGLRLLRLNLME